MTRHDHTSFTPTSDADLGPMARSATDPARARVSLTVAVEHQLRSDDVDWHYLELAVARYAASARLRGVPPEQFLVQLKECVRRARDRPVGRPMHRLMREIVQCAIGQYYGTGKPVGG